MTYEELKQIANPHIRERENLPSNSLLLLTQFHIPYKTEKQCEQDFEDKINPLKINPAFLSIDSEGNKTVYFSSNTQYWNFYIFHEIAHYLLGHEQNSPQNEIDADMLACILAAPIENLPTYLKSARDLSTLCKIPIDKAEMYWQEISINFSKPHKKLLVTGIVLVFLLIIISLTILLNSLIRATQPTTEVKTYSPASNNIQKEEYTYYMTTFGTHYHIRDCQYVKYKTNVISISLDEAKKLNLKSCEKCIK